LTMLSRDLNPWNETFVFILSGKHLESEQRSALSAQRSALSAQRINGWSYFVTNYWNIEKMITLLILRDSHKLSLGDFRRDLHPFSDSSWLLFDWKLSPHFANSIIPISSVTTEQELSSGSDSKVFLLSTQTDRKLVIVPWWHRYFLRLSSSSLPIQGFTSVQPYGFYFGFRELPNAANSLDESRPDSYGSPDPHCGFYLLYNVLPRSKSIHSRGPSLRKFLSFARIFGNCEGLRS
jgi:hypothetical protein